jgi:hypothetical protein
LRKLPESGGCDYAGGQTSSDSFTLPIREPRTDRTLARIRDVDWNGPPANQELFRWLDGHGHRGYRVCEYKVHHPRACRAYALQTERGWVIVRIEDKTDSERQFNETMRSVKAAIDDFLKEGERYE